MTKEDVRVWLNGKKLKVKNFHQYVDICKETMFAQLQARARPSQR